MPFIFGTFEFALSHVYTHQFALSFIRLVMTRDSRPVYHSMEGLKVKLAFPCRAEYAILVRLMHGSIGATSAAYILVTGDLGHVDNLWRGRDVVRSDMLRGGGGREVVDNIFSEARQKMFCHTISVKSVDARVATFDGDAKLRSGAREIEKKVENPEFASQGTAVRDIAPR